MKTFDARSADRWRKWLAAHHDSESEVWLVFRKGGAAGASLTYEEALDEALCFGWIDSLVRRLDDVRYARKFTPRRRDSRWSTANRKRYARLRAEGRIRPAGLNRPPAGRSGDAPAASVSAVPAYILEALGRHPGALRCFKALAPSYRRLYVGWIDSAKREETKLRRLREAIGLLAAGRKLGLK